MVSLLRALLLLALASSLGCGRDLKRRDGGDAISADAPMVGAKDVLPSTPSAEVAPDLDRDAADGREADGNPDMAAATPCVGSLPATYPIPGCSVDGGRTDAPDVAADRPPSPDGAICSGICNAAVPTYPTVDVTSGSGNVTMYTTLPSSGGACNYGTTSVAYFAAINVNVEPGDDQGQWQGGRICGQCVEVTTSTSQGSRSVVVRIMDRCADAYCGVDLGGDAPVAVMPDGFGRYDGTWRFVPCAGHPEASDGSPSLYVVAGSNAWWSRVQVRNPPWAVESIAWRDPAGSASGSFPYAADPENTFAVPSDVLQATASLLVVTVRYGDGTTATAELAPAQLAEAGTSYPLQ